MTIEERIRGRKIGVIGMARSGMAAARLALEGGGLPFVSDSGSAEKLKAQCDELKNLGLPFETEGHTGRLLECDYLVVSPGVPPTIDVIVKARERGIPVFSELEFASWLCKGRIIAVTGSNGKTTTTTLIGEILTAAGFDTHVCGNIGRPFAEVVNKTVPDSVVVVEISSFQLETISEFKPFVAAILNLTPDHIDRHGSFEKYKQAKYRVTENQTDKDVLVLNREDRETIADNPTTRARRIFFSAESRTDCDSWVEDGSLWARKNGGGIKVIEVDDIAIKGPHNLQNAATAVAVVNQFGVDPETMARVLKSFPGVEHRLEKAGSVAGVEFINDSKATNVDSVLYALRSMTAPTYLILGGRDKEGDFRPIAEIGKGKVKGIVAIGEAREKIFGVLGKAFPTQFADSLDDAVRLCFDLAIPGETVLLSPGCASFDQFENFEHRGRVFKTAVGSLKNGKNSDEIVSG